MARFYATWNLPGSSKFDYILFEAKSRKEAIKKSNDWYNDKEEECLLSSDIANGFMGKIVSFTEGSKWKYQSGSKILREEIGYENFNNYILNQKTYSS